MEKNGGNVEAAWSGSGGGEFVIEEKKNKRDDLFIWIYIDMRSDNMIYRF